MYTIETYRRVEKATSDFLAHHPGEEDAIDADYWVLRNVTDLLPVTVENFFSGHYFPVTEAHQELGRSIALVRIGYYQHAMMGLRWVLELGCLSVYWDRFDNAAREIKSWLRSQESTPFKRQVVAGLLKVPNIRAYAAQAPFESDFNDVYGELSRYTHVMGVRYSSHAAYSGGVIQFSEKAFRRWAALRRRVTKLVATVHLLKYPVGLQYTPMFDKFGLNPPAGGFLEPGQTEQVASIFSQSEWSLLRAISDADPSAVSAAEWVNSRENISEEEVLEQSHAMDREMVRNQGYTSWFEMYSQIYRPGSDAHAKFLVWAEELEVWAREHGWIEHGEHGPLPKRFKRRK